MPSNYLLKFDPKRDSNGWVSENPHEYAIRIGKLLPNWPEEILIEWIHRHNTACGRYEHLKFERFRFRKERWALDKIPNRNAFLDPTFYDNFQDIQRRASDTYYVDWLARYMLENGTWNTPPILLENIDGSIKFNSHEYMKSPYHLLEGHRRLSFLNGLKVIECAKAEHDIWIVTLA